MIIYRIVNLSLVMVNTLHTQTNDNMRQIHVDTEPALTGQGVQPCRYPLRKFSGQTH